MNVEPKKALTFFSLIMINVIAVDSLRTLTVGAEYGLSLVFFYALAAVLFFLPIILVSAELATAWPTTGGVYIWVREAFGPRIGCLTIWLQWIYNVIWYPTILAFIAGVLAFLIDPNLVNNKIYMFCAVLSAFWFTTFFNCLGLKTSNWLNTVGAIVGTLIPMVLITALGLIWISLGKTSHIEFDVKNLFPTAANMNNIAFFTNVLFGLLGMEMCAVHAGDVRNPVKDYPRALFYSGTIILVTLVLASLAITIVVPVQQLNLVSGLMDAFTIFFKTYHMNWFVPIIAFMIIAGSLSSISAWSLGPARGLMVASKDNLLPKFFAKQNRQGMPVGILFLQGGIVTILCSVFLIMPNVNSSYWILSNLTAQLALLFYIFMFSAAIYLRYRYPHIKRAYKIPGGLLGISIVAGIGISTCVAAIIIGFIPPKQIAVGNIFSYEIFLIVGMIISCLLPLAIGQENKY